MSAAEPLPTPTPMKSDLFFNRELSLLSFNRRVLEQARDAETPLMERLRFLCISSNNLDEFFEIRVARLKAQILTGSVQAGPDNLSAQELLQRIGEAARELVESQYRVLNEELIPALEQSGIRFRKRSQWTHELEGWVKGYFEKELLPVLSPLGLDPAHPFPRILNKSLNFIVSLKGKDAFGRRGGIAIVQAPRALPRVIRLPAPLSGGLQDFVFLSSIIHQHVGDLFPGMEVAGCHQFRVTRNSELFVDEEEVNDLLRAVEGELSSRRWGDAVRLEVTDDCPAEMTTWLANQFDLTAADVYRVNGPVNLHRLAAVPEQVDRPELKYPSFTPGLPVRLKRSANLFDVIRTSDILLHHPYESFAPVVEFLRQAARDPDVLAIKQTLYRTGRNSAIVDVLIEAARAGKEVTVVIELRARFDEEANIGLAEALQEAGAHVVYGVVGYKTHAKMILVVRREKRRLRHYVHLGTGNYHDRTARTYTDLGLLTCNDALGEDVHKVFLLLTSLGRATKLNRLLQAPFTLENELLRRIEREAAHARKGRPAHVVAKMNALVATRVIEALYAASQAGVKIDLIVRGICCLRPGVPGVSENIQVRSVVGRFLEHPRVFYFLNDGEEEVWLSSADWMDRNLSRRVEVAFPVEDKVLKARVIREALTVYLDDNTQAWTLTADGHYERRRPPGHEALNAQSMLMKLLSGS